MSDFSLKISADKLGKSLENLAPALEEAVHTAVKDLAEVAYANIVANVQTIDKDRFRRDYLSNLKFETIGDNEYVIYLDGDWANKIEDGFAPFDMRKTHLSSEKIVEVGKRAGQPWVQQAKSDGHKFAHVPFDHKPMSAPAGSLDAAIRSMTTSKMGKNSKGKVVFGEQPITSVFRDMEGNALSGEVFRADKMDFPDLHKDLQGLVKFQHVHESGRVTSLYMTWRTLSEKSTAGWQHPGHEGYDFFTEAEKYVEQELDNIVKRLL